MQSQPRRCMQSGSKRTTLAQKRSMSFEVHARAIETPKAPIAERQRVQQTWSISGDEPLEKLRVADPGLTYISVAPPALFDEVAKAQGITSDVARVSSDAQDLLTRVDVLARGSNRLLIGFDPRMTDGDNLGAREAPADRALRPRSLRAPHHRSLRWRISRGDRQQRTWQCTGERSAGWNSQAGSVAWQSSVRPAGARPPCRQSGLAFWARRSAEPVDAGARCKASHSSSTFRTLGRCQDHCTGLKTLDAESCSSGGWLRWRPLCSNLDCWCHQQSLVIAGSGRVDTGALASKGSRGHSGLWIGQSADIRLPGRRDVGPRESELSRARACQRVGCFFVPSGFAMQRVVLVLKSWRLLLIPSSWKQD
jgi:hypothetical protein